MTGKSGDRHGTGEKEKRGQDEDRYLPFPLALTLFPEGEGTWGSSAQGEGKSQGKKLPALTLSPARKRGERGRRPLPGTLRPLGGEASLPEPFSPWRRSPFPQTLLPSGEKGWDEGAGKPPHPLPLSLWERGRVRGRRDGMRGALTPPSFQGRGEELRGMAALPHKRRPVLLKKPRSGGTPSRTGRTWQGSPRPLKLPRAEVCSRWACCTNADLIPFSSG